MRNFSVFTRRWLVTAGGLLILLACIGPLDSLMAADDTMMKSFRDYKAAWNSHDVPALVASYTKNGTYTNSGTGELPAHGRAFAHWLQGLFTAIPDFHVKVVSADPTSDNTLAGQWVITGTWKKPFPSGPLAGKKPTGKSFKVPGAEFLAWQDGKLQSVNAYYDQMTFLTQLGVIPPPRNKQASAR